MAKTYDISLLSSLQEQVAFYDKKHEETLASIQKMYTEFLEYLDGKSGDYADRPEYEDLQHIYEVTSSRLDRLVTLLDEEREATSYWTKQLTKVADGRDPELWNDLATTLIENNEYCEDASEFKSWVEEETGLLKKEMNEVFVDWRSTINEGHIKTLARLLDALNAEGDEDKSPSEVDIIEALEQEAAPRKEGGCCSSAETKSGPCCGRQTPCCRSKES